MLLAQALWSAPDSGNAELLRPLPLVVVALLVLAFPVSQAFTELPLYFGEVARRLRGLGWPSWASVGVPALGLAFQHAAMPLLLDWRFIVWRVLAFLPLAVVLGVATARRPTLLPWFMVIHALMDVQLPVLTWFVSTGALRFAG